MEEFHAKSCTILCRICRIGRFSEQIPEDLKKSEENWVDYLKKCPIDFPDEVTHIFSWDMYPISRTNDLCLPGTYSWFHHIQKITCYATVSVIFPTVSGGRHI